MDTYRTLPKNAPAFLPGNFKDRRRRTTVGRARTGEVSPKGLVAHTEDWDGRIAADTAPATMHYAYSVSTGQVRKLTFAEMVEKGYFVLGSGPKGVRQLDRQTI